MTYSSSMTRSSSVNVESLSFVDVSIGTRGDFLAGNTLTDFLKSPLGQAQASLLDEDIRGQGVTPNDTTVQRALLAEQASQTFGSRKPDILADNADNPEGKMTESQLIEQYGPGARAPDVRIDTAPVVNRTMGLA